MKKYIRFTLITVWILLSRFYDVYATYQHTPDLKQEANPLASVLHLGWAPIIAIVALLTGYIIYAFYVSTFKKYDLAPKEKGYSFIPFAIYLYLGKKQHWTAMFYKLPKDVKRFNHFMGYMLAAGMSFAGVVSTAMWLLINYTDTYYYKYHNPVIVYSVILVGVVAIALQWHIKMYKQYKLATTPVTSTNH